MRHHGLTYMVAAGTAAALAIAAASCTEALRLEPPPTPSDTTTSGTAGSGGTTAAGGGGTGGTTVSGCKSNADCPDPTPICDTAYGNCVQCLVLADCVGEPGKVCTMGTCACPSGRTYCGPNNCVDTGTDPDNCGSCGRYCYGTCAAGSCADAWDPIKDEDSCGTDLACQDTIPIGRRYHASVWTGNRMIVWGGQIAGGGFTETGGVYDHDGYEWQPTSLVNAPSARQLPSAVWTGSQMIVWGGQDGTGYTNTGGRYDPATDTWVAMSTLGAPEGRILHTAVWTGDRMIVWGGDNSTDQINTGGIYDPATDTWSATGINTTGVTRRQHTAIWNSTLGAMMIYGGYGDPPGYTNVYLPYTNAPGGEQFILATNSWSPLNTISEPPSRANHTAVFDGSDMLVWGGYNGSTHLATGYRYTQGAWLALAGPAPEARRLHTAVWIQNVGRMIVWGGEGPSSNFLDTGAEFDSATNEWIGATPTAPPGRRNHTAVAAGDQMMIWGGEGAGSNYLAGGAVYTPQ